MNFLESLAFARMLRRSKLFDADFYLRKYPDLAAAKVDPWKHYLRHGSQEGRKPNALFDPRYYRKQAAGGDVNSFLKQQGGAAGNPHPLFDCSAYVSAVPAARNSNPLAHRLNNGPGPATEGGQFGCAS